MDDFGAAVSSFLSQPGAMDQMKAMAEQLGLGPSQTEKQESPLPEGISPEVLTKILGAVSDAAKPDETTAFLEALRPLLRPEHQEKIDRALRAMHLMRAAKTVSSAVEL